MCFHFCEIHKTVLFLCPDETASINIFFFFYQALYQAEKLSLELECIKPFRVLKEKMFSPTFIHTSKKDFIRLEKKSYLRPRPTQT